MQANKIYSGLFGLLDFKIKTWTGETLRTKL